MTYSVLSFLAMSRALLTSSLAFIMTYLPPLLSSKSSCVFWL
ncbi:hypothetical protein 1013_scaffold1713_00012 [Bacteriophage sp.]|nr:hypothetical protein 1013_scaffold1713_00012 [Bacteriophage sp.]